VIERGFAPTLHATAELAAIHSDILLNDSCIIPQTHAPHSPSYEVELIPRAKQVRDDTAHRYNTMLKITKVCTPKLHFSFYLDFINASTANMSRLSDSSLTIMSS
jgi:hypothetical protein